MARRKSHRRKSGRTHMVKAHTIHRKGKAIHVKAHRARNPR